MNQITDNNEEFFEKLRLGDEYAFTLVFEQYNRMMYAFAYRYLKSTDEAEDAVQHTFMKLWVQRESYDYRCGVRSLLFTILKHYILNELRHRQIVFEKHYEIAQSEDEADDTFVLDFEKQELNSSLWAAIQALPPQKQKICRLKIEQGLSNQEIADSMQISVPTVKSHYTQAIKMLRAALGSAFTLLSIIRFYLFNQ